MKKYEFINETKTIGKTILYRIKALRDFGDVKKGDLGGFIEKEDNLSHDGNAWVYDNAMVCGGAKVFGNATVLNNADIYDNAEIYGNAVVCNYACIYGNAWIYGNACVCGDAKVYGKACIYGKAKIYNNAEVRDNAKIYDNAQVYGDAVIYGNAKAYMNAKVYANAVICGNNEICEDIDKECKTSTDKNSPDTCNNAITENIMTAREAKQISDETNADLSLVNSELKEINKLIYNTAAEKGGYAIEYLSSQSGKTIRKVVEVLENAEYAVECTNRKDSGCTLKIRWGC